MNQKEFEDKINKEIEDGVKKMLKDGFNPKTYLWMFAKAGMIIEIGKKLGINLRFDDSFIGIRLIIKWPWLYNYRILRFLANIYNLKLYIVRYTIVDGHKFFVKPAPKMWEILMDYRLLDVWEPETTKIVKENVKPGQTCIDIGASQGVFTLAFARQVGPTGRVIAVEPTDFQQPYLLKNIKVNGYKDIVEVWNVGAWDKTETVYMPRNAPMYVQTLAHCMAVDDIVKDRPIDFIKLDCDGPEPMVLKGLEKTFQRNPNLKMVVEYYPKYIKDAKLSTELFREMIDKYFEFDVIPGDYTDGCWNLFCRRNDHAKNDWSIMDKYESTILGTK